MARQGKTRVSAAAAVLQGAWPSPSPRTREQVGPAFPGSLAPPSCHPTRKVLSLPFPRLADGQRPRVAEAHSHSPIPPQCPSAAQTIAKTPTAHPDSRLLLLLLLRQHALFALLCAPSKTPACIRSSLCCELIEDQSNLSQAPLLGPTIWFPSDGHSERHIYPAACLPMIALCSPVSGENTTRITVTSQTRHPS